MATRKPKVGRDWDRSSVDWGAMKTSHYVIQPAETSNCPTCMGSVKLLCHATGGITSSRPAFYLCFACGYVAQVGVGPVSAEGGE